MIIVKNRISGLIMPRSVAGMTIYPFVFIRPEIAPEDVTGSFLNHERIHLYQQKEMLIIFFFIWYFLEFLLGWIVYRSVDAAYRQISFEREAYTNEDDLEYLKKRKLWNWLKY